MHAEDDNTAILFVLMRFGSRGEARRWPLALGWVSENDRRTKPVALGL